MEFNPEQAPQPTMYTVDATKAQSIEELGILLNALGLGMTKEYADEHGLTHLLKIEE